MKLPLPTFRMKTPARTIRRQILLSLLHTANRNDAGLLKGLARSRGSLRSPLNDPSPFPTSPPLRNERRRTKFPAQQHRMAAHTSSSSLKQHLRLSQGNSIESACQPVRVNKGDLNECSRIGSVTSKDVWYVKYGSKHLLSGLFDGEMRLRTAKSTARLLSEALKSFEPNLKH